MDCITTATAKETMAYRVMTERFLLKIKKKQTVEDLAHQVINVNVILSCFTFSLYNSADLEQVTNKHVQKV